MEKGSYDVRIVGSLKECASKKLVEETFTLHKVTEESKKIGYLNLCMGNPETFYAKGGIELKEKYEVTLQMFLAGTWKLNALYEKLGY